MHAGHKLKRSWRAFEAGSKINKKKKKERKIPTTTYARTIRVHCFHFQMGVDRRLSSCTSLTSPMVFALCLQAIPAFRYPIHARNSDRSAYQFRASCPITRTIVLRIFFTSRSDSQFRTRLEIRRKSQRSLHRLYRENICK